MISSHLTSLLKEFSFLYESLKSHFFVSLYSVNFDSIKSAVNNTHYKKLNEDVKSIFENTWAYKIITRANDKGINDERFYNMMTIGKTFFEEIFKEIAARTIHY